MSHINLSDKLFKQTYLNRIPLLCTLELTRSCNLKCKHCYLTPGKKTKELSTQKIKNILKELADAGTLFLVFTGGEIFLRDDILELCYYAKKLHFDLRIFTNGCFINKKISGYLSSIGINSVEISLYGTKHIHDWTTGIYGSFEKTVNAIKTLIKEKINVVIKTPLMRHNIKDYNWLKLFAKDVGAKIKFDITLTPKTDGTKDILKYRLSYDQLKRICIQSLKTLKIKNSNKIEDFLCSAGHNLVCINYEGIIYPCLQIPIPLGDIKKDCFKDIWSINNIRLKRYISISLKDITPCSICKFTSICRRCPGLAYLEDGSLYGPSNIACQIAKIEYSYIKKYN